MIAHKPLDPLVALSNTRLYLRDIKRHLERARASVVLGIEGAGYDLLQIGGDQDVVRDLVHTLAHLSMVDDCARLAREDFEPYAQAILEKAPGSADATKTPWSQTDFAACIRDCSKDLEEAKDCVVNELAADTAAGDISAALLRLESHLAELRGRLRDEIDWDDRAAVPTVDASAEVDIDQSDNSARAESEVAQ